MFLELPQLYVAIARSIHGEKNINKGRKWKMRWMKRGRGRDVKEEKARRIIYIYLTLYIDHKKMSLFLRLRARRAMRSFDLYSDTITPLKVTGSTSPMIYTQRLSFFQDDTDFKMKN